MAFKYPIQPLIPFTAFNTLHSLLSSPQCSQPGHGGEEPPGSHPARQRAPAPPPRDAGTSFPAGTARKTLGTTPPCRVYIYIGDQFFFSFPFCSRGCSTTGQAPRSCPGQGCSPSRSTRTCACWSHRTPSCFPSETFPKDQSLHFFSPGAGQECKHAVTCQAALTRTELQLININIYIYILLMGGSFHSMGPVLGEGRGLPVLGFASQ